MFVKQKGDLSAMPKMPRALMVYTMVRFHQTLFAKRKDAGAQRLAKNSPFNFINIFSLAGHRIIAQYYELFANGYRQTPFAILNSPNFCAEKSFASVRAKKSGKNVGEIDPMWFVKLTT